MNTTRINELVAMNRRDGFKALAVGIGIVLLAVIVGFTGYHNYRLFGRGLDQAGQLFALIPVLALEGGALWLLICTFAWFTDAKQKAVAAVAEIALIAVIALNTIVDHNLTDGTTLPAWLVTYKTLLTPAAPVAVFALIVLLFYLDPSKRRRDMLAMVNLAEQERLFQAKLAALSSDEVEAAYEVVEDKMSRRKAQELVDSVGAGNVTMSSTKRKALPNAAAAMFARTVHLEDEIKNDHQAWGAPPKPKSRKGKK